MTDTNDAMDFLMTSGGGGAPIAKFPTVGTVHKGRVLAMEKKPTDRLTGPTPLLWDNGEPRWELEITLQTDEQRRQRSKTTTVSGASSPKAR